MFADLLTVSLKSASLSTIDEQPTLNKTPLVLRATNPGTIKQKNKNTRAGLWTSKIKSALLLLVVRVSFVDGKCLGKVSLNRKSYHPFRKINSASVGLIVKSGQD